jgi:hypothetical protein
MSYKGCFTQAREWYSVSVSEPTDRLELYIEFPRGFSLSSVETKCLLSKTSAAESPPWIFNKRGKLLVHWEKFNPQTGAEYRIYWEGRQGHIQNGEKT